MAVSRFYLMGQMVASQISIPKDLSGKRNECLFLRWCALGQNLRKGKEHMDNNRV